MGSTASLDFKDPAFYKEQIYWFVEDISSNRFPKGTQQHLTPEEECLMQLNNNIREAMPNNHLFPLSCIGLLYIYKENNQRSHSIGTCFLIGGNVLLTCAHNLYTKEKKLMHHSLDYYPNGQVNGELKINIILNKQNCRIQQKYIDIQSDNYINYDYAIIFLQENLIDKYGCLKICKNWNSRQPLFLLGYSIHAEQQHNIPSLRGQKGSLTSLNKNTIHYSMQTESGQSGSPILVYGHGEWKVVGIHTLSQDAHHDPSGIYLNTEICDVINSWLKVVKGELSIEGGTRLNGRELNLLSMVQKYNWSQLTTLCIEGCRLTNQSLMHLNAANWNLSVCKFNQNLISDVVLLPDKFGNLERLYLNNNLVKRLGRQILRFRKLRKVQLNHNKLQEIDQEVIDSRLAIAYLDNPIHLDRSERQSNNQSDQ